MRAADVGPLVPVEAEPAQVLEDAGLGLARRALGVGVLDAQDERAVLAVREQPVEQRRARVADVELPGRDSERIGLASTSGASGLQPARTACAAIASPRPTASTPSLVLPLTLTRSAAMPSAPASRARGSAVDAGAIFGRSRTTDDVEVARSSKPAPRTSAAAWRSSSMLDAPFQRGSVSGKCRPMSPRHAAPRIASVAAWHDDVGVGMAERAALGRDRRRRRGSAAVPRRAGAGRSRCRSRRRRGAGCRPLPRRLEIRCRRDLHVRRIAVDDVDRVAGLLRERRLVGRLDAGAPERDGVARARRGGTPAASARGRSTRAGCVSTMTGAALAGSTRLTVSRDRQRGDRRAVRRARRRSRARSASGVTNGRAASWTSTTSASRVQPRSNALATESCRRVTAGDDRRDRPRPGIGGAADQRAGSTTMTSVTRGCADERVRRCARG